jgi:hypothetical protein
LGYGLYGSGGTEFTSKQEIYIKAILKKDGGMFGMFLPQTNRGIPWNNEIIHFKK